MEHYMGLAVVLFMAAILLGVMLQDRAVKAKAYWGALGFYLLAGWFVSTEGFRAGLMTGVFLFVLLFMVPFQIGGRLSRFRSGKK